MLPLESPDPSQRAVHTVFVTGEFILYFFIKDAVPDKRAERLVVSESRMVDARLMEQTAGLCLETLKFCVSVFLEEWE